MCDVVKTTKSFLVILVSKEVKPLLRTLSSDLHSPTFTSHTKKNLYQGMKIYDISVCSQPIYSPLLSSYQKYVLMKLHIAQKKQIYRERVKI